MLSPQKVVRFKFSNFLISTITSLLLIGTLWVSFIALTKAGFPFLHVKIEKFLDLGFFSFSTFSFIIFLTMIPFQTAEGKLSPGFYSRIVRNPWAHFGLYVLMTAAIISLCAIAWDQIYHTRDYLDQLFVALILSIMIAILFHRFWVLRYIYQPYNVYKNIDKLMHDETLEEVWLELVECTHKAIREGRVSDTRNFINLLMRMYQAMNEKERSLVLQEDLKSLYQKAEGFRPICRYMESKWSFLRSAESVLLK